MNKAAIEAVLIFVQAIFEPLPLSSSTHVLIASRILTSILKRPILPNTNFLVFSNFSSLLTFSPLMLYRFLPLAAKGWSGLWSGLKALVFIGLSCSLVPVAYLLLANKLRDPLSYWDTSLILNLFVSAVLLLWTAKFSSSRGPWTTFGLCDAAIVAPFQAVALMFTGLSRMASSYWILTLLGFGPMEAYFIAILQQCALAGLAIIKTILLSESLPAIGSGQYLWLTLAAIAAWASLFLAYKAIAYGKFHKFGLYLPIPILLIMILG